MSRQPYFLADGFGVDSPYAISSSEHRWRHRRRFLRRLNATGTVVEQNMADEVSESPGASLLAVAQNLRRGDFEIVVEDRRPNASERAKADSWPSRNASIVSAA
jgi:hypothetical protein